MNIAEILKHAPIGTILYSPIFGEVILREIDLQKPFPIIVQITNRVGYRSTKYFDSEGKYLTDFCDTECLLFPYKSCRSWDNVSYRKELPKDTLVLVADHNDCLSMAKVWKLRYYAYRGYCYRTGEPSTKTYETYSWNYIIPLDKFDLNDLDSNNYGNKQ